MIYAKRRKLEGLKRTKEREKFNLAARMRQIIWAIFMFLSLSP